MLDNYLLKKDILVANICTKKNELVSLHHQDRYPQTEQLENEIDELENTLQQRNTAEMNEQKCDMLCKQIDANFQRCATINLVRR